jgi:5'-3' exonuclease
MGVPGFVAWLRSYFKDEMIMTKIMSSLLDSNSSDLVEILYIDGNCLIHPKCFEVIANCKTQLEADKLEKIMFKRICKYISYLVGYVQPKICYFAVDGVGPAAKINQQRYRRYKAIEDNDIKQKIKDKYKIKTINEWNNTVITPGTQFMRRLHDYLLDYFTQQNQQNKTKYIYSSYLTPGEGEHKILNHLRNLPNDNNNNYVIYGLDADLFFLSLSCDKKNIYLLREEHHFINGKMEKVELFDLVDDVSEDLRYVSIDIVKKCYNIRLCDIVKKRIDFDDVVTDKKCLNKLLSRTNYYTDFVFICYLLGNDFLPHLPTIDIKKGGLDIIIDCYIDTYININLNSNSDQLIQLVTKHDGNIAINNIFLTELLRSMSELEEQFYREIIPKYEYKMARRNKMGCLSSDPYAVELWELENMIHINKEDKSNDPIKLGYGDKDVWKFRYYEYYFNISQHYDEFVDMTSKMYLEGLVWVTKYYYVNCPSWQWKYPFAHAPFISDIYNFIVKNNFDINTIIFNIGKPLTPQLQLLAVLPNKCNDLVEKEYRYLMTNTNSPIIDMYPKSVKLDTLHKDMYWSCIPMLPYLDIDRILNATKNIKLKNVLTPINDIHIFDTNKLNNKDKFL